MTDYRSVLERDLRRVGPPAFTLDDVARRRDRRQRNRRIAAGTLALVLAAAAIGGVVRAFRVADAPRPANLPSTPDAWTRVPFPSSPGDEVLAITAGGPSLVAVGVSGRLNPVVWTSPDGRTWSRAQGSLGNGAAFDVSTGGPGLIAVGLAGGNDAPVWTSADGLTWSAAPSDPVFRGAWLRAVAVGGPGLVTVGSTMDGPAAWYSSDGVTWERASAPPPPQDVADDGADAWMQDVAVAGDRLVAVGEVGLEVCGPYCVRYDPVIWTSTDGVMWTQVALDPDVFPSSTQLRSLAVGPSGFVVVGGRDGKRADPRVWASADGLTGAGCRRIRTRSCRSLPASRTRTMICTST